MSNTDVVGVATALFGDEPPFRLRLPDGEEMGADNARATVVVRSDEATRHIARAPNELGIARAYVSGAIDVEGDLADLMVLQNELPDVSLRPTELVRFARLLGLDPWRNPPKIPAEEVALGHLWRRHTKEADAASISHHYDLSNDFYRLVLGPAMTYSCAVFNEADDTLQTAQRNKHDLVARKLGLRPGQRLLDVGCGWGSMAMHAAEHFGVEVVGITISREQAELAQKRVSDAGLADQVTIRVQDYRDLNGERFDAISSIGMFEHVGREQQRAYFETLYECLGERGRLLNHQIGRSIESRTGLKRHRTHIHRRGFMHRYVFPNGELHHISDLLKTIEQVGFEVHHVEGLREHYAKTLRLWVENLDNNWKEAVDLVGDGRARVWKLYMAASSALFATNRLHVHQVLATKTLSGGSGMPRRPNW